MFGAILMLGVIVTLSHLINQPVGERGRIYLNGSGELFENSSVLPPHSLPHNPQ